MERGVDVLLSDTVGFVRDLPHNLVASFKATLEEAVHADLLLHVLDVSDPRAQQQYESVHRVLADIGAAGKPELLLLNKTDTSVGRESMDYWLALHPEALAISAKTGRGLDEVFAHVAGSVRGTQAEIELEADVTDGKLLAFLDKTGGVLDRQFDGDTVRVFARVSRILLGQLRQNPNVRLLSVTMLEGPELTLVPAAEQIEQDDEAQALLDAFV